MSDATSVGAHRATRSTPSLIDLVSPFTVLGSAVLLTVVLLVVTQR
ncbi:MAG: hypothetical protein L0H93_13870 [Nocardioides sp.]|nr:hypothetical protein [Nocardioides sp.]